MRCLLLTQSGHRGDLSNRPPVTAPAWTGERMALHYIEAANRKKMAADAMHKLENKKAFSIVAPKGKVRHSGQKDE
jgi:hypothetical protein